MRGGSADPDAYIAHGGGIGPFVYTDCREAVLDSRARGLRFVEVDLLATDEPGLGKRVVGGHDWAYLKARLGWTRPDDRPAGLAEVTARRVDGRWTPLTGAGLRELMRRDPDWVLVTDKIRDYDLLLHEIPYPERMIVEVFSLGDYRRALRAGIKYPAFFIRNLSRLPEAAELGMPIVTLGAEKFFGTPAGVDAVQRLHDAGVTVLAFTATVVDRPEFVERYLGRTVSKIYTDSHAPGGDGQAVSERRAGEQSDPDGVLAP